VDWHKKGSCRGLPTEWWFPDDETAIPEKDGRDICNLCPVRQQCFDYGLKYEKYGIWGGYRAFERKHIRRRKGITLLPIVNVFTSNDD
jgi:WhiB family redox-sensing transcriptional regulator